MTGTEPMARGGTVRAYAVMGSLAVFASMTLLAACPVFATRLSGPEQTAAYRYLHAALEYERAVAPNAPAPAAAIGALARSVEVECPAVFAGAPLPEKGAPASEAAAYASEVLEEEAEELQQELALGLGYTSAKATGAVAAFIGAAESIHWASHRYAVAFRSVTQALVAERSLSAPKVCAEARAWRSSGYRALPRSTDALSEAIKHAVPSQAEQRLFATTLESLGGREAHALLATLGERITASELRLAEASGRVMQKLGLPSLLVTPSKQLASADLMLERTKFILAGLGAPKCTTLRPLAPERDLGLCRNPVQPPRPTVTSSERAGRDRMSSSHSRASQSPSGGAT